MARRSGFRISIPMEELDAPLHQGVDELVTGPRRVSAHQHGDAIGRVESLGLDRQLGQGQLEHGYVGHQRCAGPRLPGRSKAANASLVASRKQTKGEKP